MIALINFDSSLVNVMTIHAGLHSFHSVRCFSICLWYGITGNNNKKSATCVATLLQNELNSDVARFTTNTKPVLQ